MDKHIEYVLREMCKVVGADFEAMDFQKDWWFTEYTWTEEQQDEFIEWLAKYLKKRSIAKHFTLYASLYKPKDIAKAFVWQYGWKLTNINVKSKIYQ